MPDTKSRSILPLVGGTIVGFILVIVFIIYNYSVLLRDLEQVLLEAELESEKMHIISELMEMARSRTRNTSRIIDIEDPFLQDELNVELENHAGRFANLRGELLKLPLTEDEKAILAKNDAIVPVILPAQRSVVTLAMSRNQDDEEEARRILYDVVLPGQGDLIKNFGQLIELAQERIAQLTSESLVVFKTMRERNYRLIAIVLTIAVSVSIIIILKIRNIQRALRLSNLELAQLNINLENRIRDRTQELRELNDRLRKTSELDELTGVYNRRKFNTYIEYEYTRTVRANSCFSLMMVDIDFFKAYNDNYGHQQGDQCIEAVAGAIKQCLPRSIDFVARYGGEEFVIVLPDTDADGAKSVAEKIRQSVLALEIEHAFSQAAPQVTISLGVTTFKGGESLEIEAIIERADKCLYAAKSAGRNRAVSDISG